MLGRIGIGSRFWLGVIAYTFSPSKGDRYVQNLVYIVSSKLAKAAQ